MKLARMTERGQAQPGQVRRSWSFVALVFGGLFFLIGLISTAVQGGTPPAITLVGIALVFVGLAIRPWGQRR
ncbi:MAG TPA: hypothetical protein VJ456_06735 [Acidimicrobiia bacterium]|nr:hypothetical protein [Acidimicrobiia bacterium]